ncbi:MAG: roadblock/LC7 domain-containing protein [bacterium]
MSENMRVDKDSISLLVALAEDFYDNDSFIEAINYCNMILSQFPDLKDAEVLLLKCYKKLNDEASFKVLSEKLLKMYPDDETVKVAAGVVEAQAKQNKNEELKPEPVNNKIKIEEVKQDKLPMPEPTAGREMKQDIGSTTILSANETENLLDSALEEINRINGVLGSIIIEESGLIIRSKVIENLDPEITAALFSTIFNVSEDSIAKVNLGMIDRVFIEIGKVRIYLFKGNGYILGIFTEEIVKIGLILIKAKQLLKNIKQVLE